jgi:hypothetical protein
MPVSVDFTSLAGENFQNWPASNIEQIFGRVGFGLIRAVRGASWAGG